MGISLSHETRDYASSGFSASTASGAGSGSGCSGTSTSGCVRATVIDAFSENYRVAVAEDGCFDRVEVSHAINLFDIDAKYADVLTVKDIVAHRTNALAIAIVEKAAFHITQDDYFWGVEEETGFNLLLSGKLQPRSGPGAGQKDGQQKPEPMTRD